MRNVLIDTNIYLYFYNAHVSQYQLLLNYLVVINERIFITDQIINEINRNKIKVFNDSFSEYIKKCSLSNFAIPKQYFVESDVVSNWNESYKKNVDQLKSLQNGLQSMKNDLIESIYWNRDGISEKLSDVYKNSISPNEFDISNATNRKKLGNPPGKVNDPIGDQLSWEQFLRHIKESEIKVDDFFIVSNDNDYFIQDTGKGLFLNPLLYHELQKIVGYPVQVHCFSKLAYFVKYHSENNTSYFYDNKNVLAAAVAEESANYKTINKTRNHFMHANSIVELIDDFGLKFWYNNTKMPFLLFTVYCWN